LGRAVQRNFDELGRFHARSVGQSRLFAALPGAGPTLLFVHGGFHGAWCWTPFLTFFRNQNMPVAALDLPGHGGLTPPPQFLTMGISDMAAEIALAARTLGGSVILAGHSLGALAAMAAAERVKPEGLILLAPAPPANVTGVRLLPALPADAAIIPPATARARKWFMSGYSGGDLAPYMARLCPESPAFLNDLYLRNIKVDRGWIKGPVLCLSGGTDDSPLHPAGQDEAVAAFFGAALEKLPEAGHCLMLDDSRDAAAHAILKWLKTADHNR
jgi:pimeloyl-ACP methyl ester carboxylesterase